MNNVHNDLSEILLSEEIIESKVELAQKVSADYVDKELHLVTVLKGAFVFLADFCRALTIQTTLDFIVVSSYFGTKSLGEVRILKDLDYPVKKRHVLLVEDIIDNGVTLQYLINSLTVRKPASLKVCTLLDKEKRDKSQRHADYTGFTIPDKFVVGYGMDYKEQYRESTLHRCASEGSL